MEPLKNHIIFIASHARFSDTGQLVNGTSSQLILHLQKKKISFIALYHSLFPGLPTHMQKNKNPLKKIGLSFLPFPLQLLQDSVITLWYVWKRRKHIDFFIGINPVNAFWGCICKQMGIIHTVVYYTADFSLRRFSNPVLSALYAFLDDFSVQHADAVWNVSSRIQKEREKVYGKQKKFFILPNSLPFPKSNQSHHDRYALILVSHLTKSIHFTMLLKTIVSLQKKFPKLTLHIVGDGPERKHIQRLAKKQALEEKIYFYGHLTHAEVTRMLQKAGIGLGIYTNENSWTSYGDSMKVREYVAYGLPVIITDVPSTADDIQKYRAGIVIRQNKKDFIKGLNLILSNKYKIFQKNALRMAKEYDYTVLLERALDQL